MLGDDRLDALESALCVACVIATVGTLVGWTDLAITGALLVVVISAACGWMLYREEETR